MVDLLTLHVNGDTFDGWKEVSLHRGFDALAGSFELGLTERYPDHPDKWVIEAGQACDVTIGGERVLTGYIDDASYAFDANSHTVTMTGREKTADLVDCSVIHGSGSFKNRTVEQIAAEIARPFGINVISVDGAGNRTVSTKLGAGHAGKEPLRRLSLQQGETAWEVIDRIARQRSVMAITNADGDLELRKPAMTRAGYALVQGVNVRAATFKNNVRDRYSDYLLKGHPHGQDGDFLLGTSDTRAYTPKATAQDPGVPRYRPLMIINEETSTGASLAARAKWEATIRAGKARSVQVTVSGWRTDAGELYQIDRLVPVHIPRLGVDEELLVAGVQYRKAADTTCVLTLVPKEAYSLIDLPAPKGKKKKGGGADPLLGLS